MIESALPFISVGALIVGVVALVVAAYILRNMRRAMELMLERKHQEHSLEAQQEVGQSGEEQSETAEWRRQRLLEDLEQWLRTRLQIQQQAGQQEQKWIREAERQEQPAPERGHHHSMEELGRLRSGYLEAQREAEQLEQEGLEVQRQAEQLKQEYSEAQQRAEQLKQEYLKLSSELDI